MLPYRLSLANGRILQIPSRDVPDGFLVATKSMKLAAIASQG